MKIRFAIISSDILAQVRAEINVLQHAVNAGNMDEVDAATVRLLKLTADCKSLNLSEKEWRSFLNEVRGKNPDFKSNYLLPSDLCTPLFPTIDGESYVLELPIDEDINKEKVDV